MNYGSAGPEERWQAVLEFALNNHWGCIRYQRPAASQKVQLWISKTGVAPWKSPEVWSYAGRPSYATQEPGAEACKWHCGRAIGLQNLGSLEFCFVIPFGRCSARRSQKGSG